MTGPTNYSLMREQKGIPENIIYTMHDMLVNYLCRPYYLFAGQGPPVQISMWITNTAYSHHKQIYFVSFFSLFLPFALSFHLCFIWRRVVWQGVLMLIRASQHQPVPIWISLIIIWWLYNKKSPTLSHNVIIKLHHWKILQELFKMILTRCSAISFCCLSKEEHQSTFLRSGLLHPACVFGIYVCTAL